MNVSSLCFSHDGNTKVWPTLVGVFTTAALMSIRTQDGFLTYKSNEVLALVVPIAGTIVALALPAAQLAQSVMESFLSTGNDLVKARRPLGEVATFLKSKAQERRRDLGAMRCVVLYGLASLLVALCGVVGFFTQTQVGEHFVISDFIASLATTLLVASVLWFLPVVRTSFNFDRAEAFASAIAKAAEREAKLPPAERNGDPAPATESQPPKPAGADKASVRS